jgi:glycosidase
MPSEAGRCLRGWNIVEIHVPGSSMRSQRIGIGGWVVALLASMAVGATLANDADPSYRDRRPEDEVIYFLLPDRFENGNPANDRGGLTGGRLQTGFDSTDKGFYHGGDLAGVTARLDYVQSLGATAIWLAPVFVNQTVQGRPGQESAGYHGYWITDFTRVDPHFGSNAELSALIHAAHARGMKLYLDIVVNHTADIIAYRECPESECAYRSRADYPYQRHGGVAGEPINEGFRGDDAAHQTSANFAHLTRPDYAYTPYVPREKAQIKFPAWLNDPIYYHNRGESTFAGESSTLGDFFGLDDIMTENPRVVRGFIDIYGDWISKFGVDGFRIDTAKHVNPEFFQVFVPAMLARARAAGIGNFHIFGEVYSIDPGVTAFYTRIAKLPAVLDFPFAKAVRDAATGVSGTDKLAALFALDALYEGGEQAALRLPTFVSNHDQGRFGFFLFQANPQISDDEALKRTGLAYALTFLLRGVPVVYYGDEQGLAGAGGDRDAREDMFPSHVASFNSERIIGGSVPNGATHFDTSHPLYKLIRDLARLRTSQPALHRGRQLVRSYGAAPGLFAVSRIEPATGREVLIVFNTANTPQATWLQVEARSSHFTALRGRCERDVRGASYHVELAPLEFIVCAASADS